MRFPQCLPATGSTYAKYGNKAYLDAGLLGAPDIFSVSTVFGDRHW